MEQLLFAPWFAEALQDSRLVRAECEAAALPLLKSAFTDIRFTAAGTLKPADLIDDRLQIAASLGDIAACYARKSAGGWLPIDQGAATARRAQLQAGETAPRIVGFAWRPTGSALGGLEPFAPLFETPGISWVALPMGNVASPLAQFLSQAGCPLIFESTWLRDGLESAAGLLSALDLVISSDDLAATLAGALGKPVWKIARPNAHWSWGAEGETSRWHPTARIFRVAQGNDEPTAAMRAELAQFAGV